MPHRKHRWHAFPWTFGQYGPQNIHMHFCITPSCQYELVGPGRACAGRHTEHRGLTVPQAHRWGEELAAMAAFNWAI